MRCTTIKEFVKKFDDKNKASKSTLEQPFTFKKETPNEMKLVIHNQQNLFYLLLILQ